MDNELNTLPGSDPGGGKQGGAPKGSGTSPAKRVIALLAVAALLVVGVGVVPMLFANRQAELNMEALASSASYQAAAQLKLKTPTRGLTAEEIEELTPESELLTDAEVDFTIPYAEDNKCAVIFFGSSDVYVETEAGSLNKNALSEGIVYIWVGNGTENVKLSVSEGEKKYTILLKDVGNGEFKASVAAEE